MNPDENYSPEFFEELREGARRSARAVIPAVLEYVRPASVIDVGCGTGAWLSVFREAGVEDVWGIDGAYVDIGPSRSPERFLARDLARPFAMGRRFDLVLSLEVAEHLPPESAEAFVRSLAGLGPVVLFSAAAPYQGGTHHVNERWPAYWASRFEAAGLLAVDCLRLRFWADEDVEWWYCAEPDVLRGPARARAISPPGRGAEGRPAGAAVAGASEAIPRVGRVGDGPHDEPRSVRAPGRPPEGGGDVSDHLRIIVLGYLVRGPFGGMAWHHLNYVGGLAGWGTT